MILKNIQLQQHKTCAIQWTGKNINEIIEILNSAHGCSFSFNGTTWIIKPYAGLSAFELCIKEILVFFKVKERTFFQVYSVEIYNEIFANRLAFE